MKLLKRELIILKLSVIPFEPMWEIAQCEAGEPIRPSEEDMMYTPPVRRHAHIWPAPRGARVEREVEEKENEGKANDSDMA